MSSSEDEDMFLLCLLESEEEEKRQKTTWVHPINEKRETYGEFHHLFPDLLKDRRKFFQYFRMSPEKFYELLNMLRPVIEKQDTTFRRPVSPEERLAVCLRFLSTGDTYRTIAFSYRLGETTVRQIVYDVCTAMWSHMQPIFMPNPDEAMWEKIEEEFRTRWNFPNCIGAMDGKHVLLDKPPNTGTLYYNYKNTFSIVLLAVVDAHYRFVLVDVGALGTNSDGGVFSNCAFGKKLQKNELNIPPAKQIAGTQMVLPHVIVADEAFPLQTHVMRPYPGNELADDDGKRTYNYRLSRARNTSEDAFGILTKRFRIYQRKLQIWPENMTTCVLATLVLHNFLREDCINLLNELPDEPIQGVENLRRVGGNFSDTALDIRDSFKMYFNSSEGSVPWQHDIVTAGTLFT